MILSNAELFEMNLYYREVIGRDGAPGFVKESDIIKLLDHVAALEQKLVQVQPVATSSAPKKKRQVPTFEQTSLIELLGGDDNGS